ncbi:PREDICTED: probable 28S rRNA (cytosine-C(5))-methyltransferase [Priapulus caudatus]|uniref:Probable 28S rRNA (Cytosine-C(5))-methyltransferase n=1 Tax=Priapulus caudatus TaxID=37621 RepID=A0ABM1F2C8_PRICU|nr:PREDICTED: probable 28S rRNA (cytosine-C(5))-methyltransferase [Priapulus caudatus]
MYLYLEAAKVIDRVTKKSGSVKSLVLGGTFTNKKKLYALVCETLKYTPIINDIVESEGLLKKEKSLHGFLVLPLVYDLLFGKGLASGNKTKDAVLRHKVALKARLARLMIKAKVVRTEDLLTDHLKPEVTLPRYIRINTLISTTTAVIQLFQNDDYDMLQYSKDISFKEFVDLVAELKEKQFVEDAHIPELLVFAPGTDLHNHPLYKNGSIIFQDKASCLPALLLKPPPGSIVIDACAAPGNKTTHLATIMENDGTIYGIDRDSSRLSTMKVLITRAGASCITLLNKDFLKIMPTSQRFSGVEYILLDPSCSGSGIANRLDHLTDSDKPSPERLTKLSSFQLQALKHALSFPKLKRLVYSTCSIYDQENELVVQAALKEYAGRFRLASVLHEWKCRGKNLFSDAENCLRASPKETATNGFFVAVFDAVCSVDAPDFQAVTSQAKPVVDDVGQQGRGKKRKSKEKRKNSQNLVHVGSIFTDLKANSVMKKLKVTVQTSVNKNIKYKPEVQYSQQKKKKKRKQRKKNIVKL